MTKGKLTPEEIEYVQEELAKVKINIMGGIYSERTFDLFKNLVIHCNENIFDREAAKLKKDLELFIIERLEKGAK